jgi:hypothetical protein
MYTLKKNKNKKIKIIQTKKHPLLLQISVITVHRFKKNSVLTGDKLSRAALPLSDHDMCE